MQTDFKYNLVNLMQALEILYFLIQHNALAYYTFYQ